MKNFDNDNITKAYWLKLWQLLRSLLSPFMLLLSLFTKRGLHSGSYLWSLFVSKWYHWRCEIPAGHFIFGLYFCIIAAGTVLLVLSQYQDLYFAPFNLYEVAAASLASWQQALSESSSSSTGPISLLASFCGISWNTLVDFVYTVKLGPINVHNCHVVIDALFTATSATCLTGMTTTDVSKYPPLILVSLILMGAASIIIVALSFNINSYFHSESNKSGSLSLEEYSQGRSLGNFTLKAMYGFIMLGIISLTIYFLPPTTVENFLRSQLEGFLAAIQANLLYIFVWLTIAAFAAFLIYKLWNQISLQFYRFLASSLVYYGSITSLFMLIILWLFYAEGHWASDDFFRAIYRAIFLSVSAFTNAGFDTYHGALAERLGRENANQWMTALIMLLIFFGSLGMQVVRELPHVAAEFSRALVSGRFTLSRFGMKISFHTKLVLLTNIILWLLAAFMFWFLETTKGISLDGLSSSETFFTTAFQSINMRTAGFSIHADVSLYTHPTLLMIMIMMLIGGSPNSMSGGMKVTTVAILFLTAKSLLERRDAVYAFGEAISEEAIHKAMTTFVLTISCLTLALMLIFSFYDGQETDYFRVAFDVVGAFTTIGLNTGIKDWNIPCKLVLIICMCFGKIGVLTIGMSLYNQTKRNRGINK